MQKVEIIGKLNKSRQRRCVYSKKSIVPTLMASMGMGGGLFPI